jgi:pimeloyl-ACP methyl ester carboxylesterase
MRRDWLTFGILAVVLTATVGCEQALLDEEARKLIVPADVPGVLAEAVAGTGEGLIEGGLIHHQRMVEMTDGAEIHTWVLESEVEAGDPARGTVVVLHPLLTSKSRYLMSGVSLARHGWHVVLIDMRAHGRSGGEYFTWGAKEKHDVKAVVDALLADGEITGPLFVYGASAGGCVAVQYAALDPRVRGVMAVAPPAGLRRIGRRILPLISEADYERALQRAGEMGEFDPAVADAVAAASKLSCPLILLHGRLDAVVPFDHGRNIYDAAPEPKKLIERRFYGHMTAIALEGQMVAWLDELESMARPVGE